LYRFSRALHVSGRHRIAGIASALPARLMHAVSNVRSPCYLANAGTALLFLSAARCHSAVPPQYASTQRHPCRTPAKVSTVPRSRLAATNTPQHLLNGWNQGGNPTVWPGLFRLAASAQRETPSGSNRRCATC